MGRQQGEDLLRGQRMNPRLERSKVRGPERY